MRFAIMSGWVGGRMLVLLVVVVFAGGMGGCRARLLSRAESSSIPGLKAGEDPAGQQLTGKKRGGRLTAYLASGFNTLDPGQSYYTVDYAVDYATQRPLFAYRPNNASTVEPDMAALMPTIANRGITDGGRTVIVHIRADVRFSPPVNRAVTAADIAYAIERGAKPSVANPYFATYFGSKAVAPLEGAQSPGYEGGPIPGIATPNASTIVFRMTRPGAALLVQALSLPLSAPVPESLAGPLDRHDPTTYGTTYLVATGPYMLKSDRSGRFAGVGYQAGNFATLVRNPNWNPAGDYRPAYLDQISVRIGGSRTVDGEQVLNGSDAVQLDAPAQSIVNQAYASYPSQITFSPGQGEHYVALDNAAGPMKNVNARRAVWAALDRAAIVAANGGPLLAEPMTHFIYPGLAGYAQAGGAGGPQTDYNARVSGDLNVAEKYMKLAGYPNGKYTGAATIHIVAADGQNFPAVTQIVNDAFTRLGFHTHVDELDQGAMYQDCGMPSRQIDACPSVGWVRDFGDPQTVIYPTFDGPQITTSANANWGIVDDPQINRAMARAAVLIGASARSQAWADVDRMLVEQAVAAPETFDNAANIESRDVAGVDAVWNGGTWDLDYTSLR